MRYFSISVWERDDVDRVMRETHRDMILASTGFDAAKIMARHVGLRDDQWQTNARGEEHSTPYVIRNNSTE